MLRVLISENRIDYSVVEGDNVENRRTVHVSKNGPIAVIITSARNNVEEELLTRLVIAPCDESGGQTNDILAEYCRRATGAEVQATSGSDVELWRDYQEWLQLGGPYDAVVPFANAILAAWHGLSAVTQLRIRRDLPAIVTAIASSAIAHKAQRQVDGKGRLIATIEDYAWAYEAFAAGLSGLYHPQVSPAIIRLVKVFERLVAGHDAEIKEFEKKNPGKPHPDFTVPAGCVRATHRQIMTALGISSKNRISERIAAALAAGVLEIKNPDASRTAPRVYGIKISSVDLASAVSSGSANVMPSPDEVRKLMADQTEVDRILQSAGAAHDTTEDGNDDIGDEVEEDIGDDLF